MRWRTAGTLRRGAPLCGQAAAPVLGSTDRRRVALGREKDAVIEGRGPGRAGHRPSHAVTVGLGTGHLLLAAV